jgi:hypothetical protein
MGCNCRLKKTNAIKGSTKVPCFTFAFGHLQYPSSGRFPSNCKAMEAKEQSIFSFQMLPLTVRFFVVNKTARYRQLTAGVGNIAPVYPG